MILRKEVEEFALAQDSGYHIAGILILLSFGLAAPTFSFAKLACFAVFRSLSSRLNFIIEYALPPSISYSI